MEETRDENGQKDYIGWPIGTQWRMPQPKTIEQRIEHAKKFRELFNFPAELEFVADTIDNSFNSQYAAWPDSAYMICKGKMHYRSQLEAEGFRSSSFSAHIEDLLESRLQAQ